MSDQVRSHPIYAAVYDRYNRGAERTWLGDSRRVLLAHAKGRVLEIGAGTGVNLLHYPKLPDVESVTACEPDPAYRRRLRRRAGAASPGVEVVDTAAERLPFPDHSFDTAVSTLVLCSVDDPLACVRELRRVLRPGGSLLLIEHVRSDRGGFARAAQRAAVPIWRMFVGGCRLHRATGATVRAAGFEIEELRRFHPPRVPSVMFPFVVAVARPVEELIT